MVQEEQLSRDDVDIDFKLTKRAVDLTGEVFGNLTILGVYKKEGSTLKWVAECSCGNIVKTSRNKLVGRGKTSCVSCAEKARVKPVDAKILTLNEVRPDIRILSLGDGLFRSECEVMCLKCNEEYEMKYSSLYLGTKGCSCKRLQRKKLEDKEVYLKDFCLNRQLIFLGWDNDTTTANMFCPKHQYTYKSGFWNMYAGKGCSKCGNEARGRCRALTLDEFVSKAKAIHGDLYTYDKVSYVNSNTNVLIGCKSCGRYNSQKPANHLHGKGCKYCCVKGFNATEPCYIYVMKAVGLCEEFYKVGITKDVRRRYNDFNRSFFEVDVMFKHLFETGAEARFVENLVLNDVETGVINKELFPDGHTETFEVSDFKKVISIIEDYVKG